MYVLLRKGIGEQSFPICTPIQVINMVHIKLSLRRCALIRNTGADPGFLFGGIDVGMQNFNVINYSLWVWSINIL